MAPGLDAMRRISGRLSDLSRRSYQNPYTAVEWPGELDPEAHWFTSPELLSLYGTPVWETFDESTRRRLAFLEAANFYSLNIHGEKSLMKGLAARLYRPDLQPISEYLHHFLDEENKHSIYFGGFCTRYAKVYRSRHVPFELEQSRDIADFLFFAKTLVFEELADRYNWLQARDERLHPLARFINDNHHREEARHLVFGRELVRLLWRESSWDERVRDDIRLQLGQFLAASWREYYNPDVYADLGLDEPWELAELAWSAPSQRAHRRRTSARCVEFLAAEHILSEEPSDAF
ncbi:diiron oxygenase [Actinocorallia sp. B10E7]|uniref:diiron oxygenase n=1 Tax=Actinocorallia sp. B10E7 TaxID=3153558 RepID=UPI00325C9F36